MIEKIVFVFSKYFENKDWTIFNCPYFLERGYDIEIWSVVKIHYYGMAKEPLHIFRDFEVKYFENWNSFKFEIQKKEKGKTIFMIYPSLGENRETGYMIRKIVKCFGFEYCDYCYPPYLGNFYNEKDLLCSWAEITKYYIANLNRKNINDFLFSIMYSPRYIFVSAKENIRILVNKYDALKPNKLVYINTPDYDKFISENSQNDLEILRDEGLEKEKYIVFIDEAHTHHSDIMNMGLKPWVTEDVYRKDICTMFDFIENHTGMKVVVALHPKAEYKDGSIFGNRKMIQEKSRILIKYSFFVIMDISTSLSYVMLYKKKIMFYTTEQLKKNSLCKQIVPALANFFECRIVNISKKIPDDFLDTYVKQVEEDKRKAYINRFVCSRRKNRKIKSEQIIDYYLRKL